MNRWQSYPMNDAVHWDPEEGVIGVVGVAPLATVDFYRRLVELTPARKDWQHVRVLIDSNPKIPSRGRHLELGETDPTPFIRDTIAALAAQGATVAAVPCNTAHILYDGFATGAPISVPHMIDVTVGALLHRLQRPPARLAVLGSRLTLAHDLYGGRLRARGGGCLDMGAVQAEVSALIELVKQGGDLDEGRRRLATVLRTCERAGADAFAIGCTELSVLVSPDAVEAPIVDANTELALACLALARTRSARP
jgi:aspartate racemase